MATLHISLPDSLKEFVREEVAEGGYATPSDYVRSLLRRARDEKLRRKPDRTLLSGPEAPAEGVTPEHLAGLRREAREPVGRKGAGSVADATFGAFSARERPEDFGELRALFEEGTAEEVAAEGLPERGA